VATLSRRRLTAADSDSLRRSVDGSCVAPTGNSTRQTAILIPVKRLRPASNDQEISCVKAYLGEYLRHLAQEIEASR